MRASNPGSCSCFRVCKQDLKPSNVLINSAGNVKLTDFGITRAISAADPCCKTFVGTLKYMAPERILSHPYRSSCGSLSFEPLWTSLFPRSYDADVWSLGLIALECATGKYPFPEGPEVSYVDLCVAVTEGPEPTVTALAESNSTLSLAFFAFLGVCLKKNVRNSELS